MAAADSPNELPLVEPEPAGPAAPQPEAEEEQAEEEQEQQPQEEEQAPREPTEPSPSAEAELIGELRLGPPAEVPARAAAGQQQLFADQQFAAARAAGDEAVTAIRLAQGLAVQLTESQVVTDSRQRVERLAAEAEADLSRLGEQLLAKFAEQELSLSRQLEETTSTITDQLMTQLREDVESTIMATAELIAEEATQMVSTPITGTITGGGGGGYSPGSTQDL